MNNKSSKIVASIEARMNSTRLPGKVLLPAFNEITMLEYMIMRLKKSKKINHIVIATTTNVEDEKIIELCKRINIDYYRGSENDVLDRVFRTHLHTSSDIIVELTGDCPLIDTKIIDESIELYLNNNFDYVSNAHVRSYPDGLDTQVFSFKLLKEINELVTSDYDRENVSSFIYRNNQNYDYKLKALIAKENEYWPDLRITLDDLGDYKLIREIINHFHPLKGFDYGCSEIISFIKKNESLLTLIENSRITVNPFQIKSNKSG